MLYVFNYVLYAIYSLSRTLANRVEFSDFNTQFHRNISTKYSRDFRNNTLESWYFSFVSLAVLPSFLFLCFKHRKNIFRKKNNIYIIGWYVFSFHHKADLNCYM